MQVKTFQIRPEQEYLQSDQNNLNSFLNSITVKKIATQYVSGQTDYWSVLVFYDSLKIDSAKSGDKISFPLTADLTEEEKKVLETLKQWRFDKAVELSLPSYLISSNAELIAVAKVKPQTPDELIKIRGFAEQKIAKYGSDIIAVLNSAG
jgi:superfamily II DNA helicase RecQ